MFFNIIQKHAMEAGMVVLEIHRYPLLEAQVLFDVLVARACVYEAG